MGLTCWARGEAEVDGSFLCYEGIIMTIVGSAEEFRCKEGGNFSRRRRRSKGETLETMERFELIRD